LLDFENKKILTYDINQNVIAKEKRTQDFHGYSIKYHNSNIYVISEPQAANGRIKILDDVALEKVGEGIHDYTSTFNFLTTQNCMNISNDTLFVNASFSDTIYYSTNKSNIKPYALLGSGNTSLSSVNKESFLLDYVKNYSVYMETGFSESDEKMIIPRGFLSIYNDIWFIELIWPYKMVIWDKKNSLQSLIDFRFIKNKELLFGYQLFKILYIDDQNYAYSSIMLNDRFYDAAEEVINSDQYNDKIINTLNSFLENYPRSSNYENPIIVKFKLDTNFLKNNI